MSNFPTQALLETAERVATRWKKALSEIEQAKYGTNEWLRDAVGFWAHDVGEVWFGAGTGTRTILLDNVNNKTSEKILVKDLSKVKLTNLGLLGGTKIIQLTLLTFPSEDAVRVKVQPSPPGPVFVQPPTGGVLAVGEEYVGLLYEDNAPIATVIYLHL
jgi:hypothetical protein